MMALSARDRGRRVSLPTAERGSAGKLSHMAAKGALGSSGRHSRSRVVKGVGRDAYTGRDSFVLWNERTQA
jgi:hypothetical protein